MKNFILALFLVCTIGCGEKTDTVVNPDPKKGTLHNEEKINSVIENHEKVRNKQQEGQNNTFVVVNNSSSKAFTVFADEKKLGQVDPWQHEKFQLSIREYEFRVRSGSSVVYSGKHKLGPSFNLLDPENKNIFRIKSVHYTTQFTSSIAPEYKDLPKEPFISHDVDFWFDIRTPTMSMIEVNKMGFGSQKKHKILIKLGKDDFDSALNLFQFHRNAYLGDDETKARNLLLKGPVSKEAEQLLYAMFINEQGRKSSIAVTSLIQNNRFKDLESSYKDLPLTKRRSVSSSMKRLVKEKSYTAQNGLNLMKMMAMDEERDIRNDAFFIYLNLTDLKNREVYLASLLKHARSNSELWSMENYIDSFLGNKYKGRNLNELVLDLKIAWSSPAVKKILREASRQPKSAKKAFFSSLVKHFPSFQPQLKAWLVKSVVFFDSKSRDSIIKYALQDPNGKVQGAVTKYILKSSSNKSVYVDEVMKLKSHEALKEIKLYKVQKIYGESFKEGKQEVSFKLLESYLKNPEYEVAKEAFSMFSKHKQYKDKKFDLTDYVSILYPKAPTVEDKSSLLASLNYENNNSLPVFKLALKDSSEELRLKAFNGIANNLIKNKNFDEQKTLHLAIEAETDLQTLEKMEKHLAAIERNLKKKE